MNLSNTAMGSKLFNIKWSQMPCDKVMGVVRRLETLGDEFDERADQAAAAGQTGEADAYQHIANEAHLEADVGRLHYENGNCQ